jgi:uridine kinase
VEARVDARVETFAALAGRLLSLPARLGTARLVAIDGPSGSGKTTFAGRFARAMLAGTTVEVVPTDAFLDGWAAPLSVWPLLRANVLDPIADGRPGTYRSYDWAAGRFADDVTPVAVPDVLILEGVTSAAAAVRAELSLAVFVTGDAAVRSARSLSRDGAEIAADLREWQTAETMYFDTERTAAEVDVVVDGTTDLRHDPEKEYVRLRCAGAPTGGWRQ